MQNILTGLQSENKNPYKNCTATALKRLDPNHASPFISPSRTL